MGSFGDVAGGFGSGAMSGAPFGPWGILIGAGIGGVSSIYAAKKQSDAQEHAADIQAKAAADTLTFEKQQAGINQANFQTAQNANYAQWLYRQGIARPYQGAGLAAENTLSQLLGLPATSTTLPDLPAAPQFQTSGSAPGATTQPSTPSGQPSSASSGMPSGIDPRIAAVYQKYGVTPGARGSGPSDWQYYQYDATKNAGGDINYIIGRLDQDLANRNAPQAASKGQTIGSYAGMPQAPTPAGTASPLPFLPLNSLGGAYLMPQYGVV